MSSNAVLAQCALRELKLRKRVYPNRVMTKRMTQAQADREVALMAEILEHFRDLAHGDADQELFDVDFVDGG